VRNLVPDAEFGAKQGNLLLPERGDYRPDYRPDESERREQARRWLAMARGESAEVSRG
jgi:hypothetical protein